MRWRSAALAALLLCGPAAAKDLGTTGHLFEIGETDLIAFIQQRLKGMEESGELARMQRETEERIKAHAVRPTPVAGLSPATTDRTFTFDPTFTVGEDITDMQGRFIARKGDKVNPLDKVSMNQTLYFIDGDDRRQVAWVKRQLAGRVAFKVILVNGNVKEASDALDEPAYFDQAGVLTTKFGFTHVPARVSQDGRVLRVDEIVVTSP